MRKKKQMLEIVMTVMVLTASFFVGQLGAGIAASGRAEEEKQRCGIIIDAGHGGMDGGKIGVNGEVEKEINLQIAEKLKGLLEQRGITVAMTRTGDDGLYDEGEPNKKQQDMKRRCELINETKPKMAVSIHQNSYTQESVRGPQVFYYKDSAEAKEIAAIMQSSLNELLEIAKPREIKANDSYYILRKTERPTVIVECGFLSNPEEAQLLSADAYQQKVAEAICAGIVTWLEKESYSSPRAL